MLNAVGGYLRSEGKVGYKDHQIAYYTYSMFDVPNKFKVNVNVHIQAHKEITVRTLALDDWFEKEKDAIDFGINKGKAYIDRNCGTVNNLKAKAKLS